MLPDPAPADSAVLAATIERLTTWTACSSPSGEAIGLSAMARLLAVDFAAVGLCTEILETTTADGPQPVLLAHGPAISDPRVAARSLLCVGHLDTVLPAFPPVRTGDHLLASGAVDMKGGLAALWGALRDRQLRAIPPPADLLLAVVPDEEVGGELSHWAMRHWGAAARIVLVLEPGGAEENPAPPWSPDGSASPRPTQPDDPGAGRATEPSGAASPAHETVVLGRRGLFTWRLEVSGRSAHAGNAFWQGRSAIAAAADWIAAAVALAQPGGPTVNPARIVGGEGGFVSDLAGQASLVGSPRQLNVVPDRATVEGEARFLRSAEGSRLRRDLEALATAIASRHEVEVRFTCTSEIPPLDPGGPAAALAERAAAIATAHGWQLGVETERGGISFPNMLPDPGAVPVLDGLGPAGGGMHTRHEWVDLRSLERRIHLLAALLDELAPTRQDGPEPTRRPA